MSQDPLSFAAGDTNLYRYVVNNPLMYRDPSGLEGESYTTLSEDLAKTKAQFQDMLVAAKQLGWDVDDVMLRNGFSQDSVNRINENMEKYRQGTPEGRWSKVLQGNANSWRDKGEGYAANLLENFLYGKGIPYVATDADKENVREDEGIWSRLQGLVGSEIMKNPNNVDCSGRPKEGTYTVNISPPPKGKLFETNIRWYPGEGLGFHAFGGAEAWIEGTVTVKHTGSGWTLSSGNVTVTLGDWYQFCVGGTKEYVYRRDTEYNAAANLELYYPDTYKPFYHQIQFKKSW